MDASSDTAEITSGMDATFSDRRNLIVREKASVECIKGRYKHLFSEAQLWREIAKMAGEDVAVFRQNATENWTRWLHGVQRATGCSSLDRAPTALVWIFGEHHAVYGLSTTATSTKGATITNAVVTVDGCDIVKADSPVETLLLWAVCLFVFNLQYGCSKITGRFMAHEVLQVESAGVSDKTAKRIITDLRSGSQQ